eukprot:1709887-Pleurochrysis_carterae.AAC.1
MVMPCPQCTPPTAALGVMHAKPPYFSQSSRASCTVAEWALSCALQAKHMRDHTTERQSFNDAWFCAQSHTSRMTCVNIDAPT